MYIFAENMNKNTLEIFDEIADPLGYSQGLDGFCER